MKNYMGEIFKENKGSIVRWVNIALIILIYYFGVIKAIEKTRVQVEQLQKQYTALEDKVENRFNRLDDSKADKEMLNLIIVSIDRIENKIDKLNANK